MNNKNKKYWKSNLKIVFSLLVIWFVSSFGFGILFSDYLDQFQIGGFQAGILVCSTGKYLCICYLNIPLCLVDEKT